MMSRAAKGYFQDILGPEEGEIYFNMLLDTPESLKKIELQYSRSKKYRLLNSLFNKGVLGKYLSGNDCGAYFILPPTFILSAVNNKKLTTELEIIYLNKHYPTLRKALSGGESILVQFHGIIENYLILFLLKYQMKDNAVILMGGFNDYEFYKKNLDENKIKKISYFYREDYGKYTGGANPLEPSKIGNKRIAIIDDEICIELLKFPNKEVFFSPEKSYFLGYIVDSSFFVNINEEKINYIKLMKKEIEALIGI